MQFFRTISWLTAGLLAILSCIATALAQSPGPETSNTAVAAIDKAVQNLSELLRDSTCMEARTGPTNARSWFGTKSSATSQTIEFAGFTGSEHDLTPDQKNLITTLVATSLNRFWGNVLLSRDKETMFDVRRRRERTPADVQKLWEETRKEKGETLVFIEPLGRDADGSLLLRLFSATEPERPLCRKTVTTGRLVLPEGSMRTPATIMAGLARRLFQLHPTPGRVVITPATVNRRLLKPDCAVLLETELQKALEQEAGKRLTGETRVEPTLGRERPQDMQMERQQESQSWFGWIDLYRDERGGARVTLKLEKPRAQSITEIGQIAARDLPCPLVDAEAAVEVEPVKPIFTYSRQANRSDPLQFHFTIRRPRFLYCLIEDLSKKGTYILIPNDAAPAQELQARQRPYVFPNDFAGVDDKMQVDKPGRSIFKCFALTKPLPNDADQAWKTQSVLARARAARTQQKSEKEADAYLLAPDRLVKPLIDRLIRAGAEMIAANAIAEEETE